MDLLLPVCISLAALGLVVAIVFWLRGRRGRSLQAFGFAALPVGLYLTGLLGLVFDAVVALGGWATRLVFNPTVWAGAALLGVAVVLWIVGGMIARRTRAGRQVDKTAGGAQVRRQEASPSLTGGSRGKGEAAKPAAAGKDNEFDDIEELLRRRGIE